MSSTSVDSCGLYQSREGNGLDKSGWEERGDGGEESRQG